MSDESEKDRVRERKREEDLKSLGVKLTDPINHPSHYGGADNPYEAIKVITNWGLNFDLGSVLKYISRHGKKPGENELKDLKKAQFYLNHHIEQLEKST